MVRKKKSFIERLTGSKQMPQQMQDDQMGQQMPVFAEDDVDMEMEMPMHNIEPHEDTMSQSGPVSTSIPIDDEVADNSEGQLTIDVYQTDNDIVIKSTIAGVKPEDLDVAINNDMITIRGERKLEDEVVEDDYYYQECYWGSFSRSVVLPVDVVAEKAEASLKNGILTVKLPKADTNKMKKIQVRGF